MLTIRKIGIGIGDAAGAMAAARYPLEPGDSPAAFAQGDYYAAGDATGGHTMWLGSERALGQLGVTRGSEVQAHELAQALQGRNAGTGEQVRRPTAIGPAVDGQVRQMGTNSYDLTFSAPKSVSVLWSQAGPAARAEIERAMFKAANAALTHMTTTKAVVSRRMDDGHRVKEAARGFAAATALHVTARRAVGEDAPSPQLHVHGVVVGVERVDGKVVALGNSEAIYKRDAPLEGGAVGRAVLAEELVKLGYSIESDTGRASRFFEVEGVPKGLMERMSGRTREVMQRIRELELARGERVTGEALSVVALETRQAKDRSLTPEQVAAVWRDLGREFAFGTKEAAALRGERGFAAGLDERRQSAHDAILERLRERGPTVTPGVMRAIAYEVAPGRLTLEDAHDLLEEMERGGELLTLTNGTVTSRQIREVEQGVMAVARAAAQARDGAASPEAVEAGIARASQELGPGKSLDEEQVQAVRELTSGSRWGVLTGRAGTGKGPVLHAVAETHRMMGGTVIGSAVDGTTAQSLGHQLHGASHCTIEQLLYRTTHGTVTVDDRTLIVLDEASKVGLRDWGRIATLVKHTGAHVLAVGHDGQLGAIELPGMFSAILSDPAIRPVVLQEIRRHRDPYDPRAPHSWLGDYQVAVDRGEAEKALAILRRENAITMQETRSGAMDAAVQAWNENRDRTRPGADILVVHGPNSDVDRLNALAQECRIVAGELPGASVEAVDRNYRIYAGDVVILREAAYASGPAAGAVARVENGTIGIVESVDEDRDIVRVRFNEPSGERTVAVEQGRLRESLRSQDAVPALRLAYAHHTFPIQGATVRSVDEVAGHWSQGKEGSYVAGTRAVHWLRVHVDRESLGRDGTDEERWLRYVRRLKRSQNRDASIRADVTEMRVATTLARPEALPVRSASVRSEKDPLDAYRDVLGCRRSGWLEQRARELAPNLAATPADALCDLEVAARHAFERLDRAGARATLSIERDMAIAAQRLEGAHAKAEELQQRAAGATDPFHRGERRALLGAADVQRGLAARDEHALGTLRESEAELVAQGRHLDTWIERHGEEAATWLASVRELEAREAGRELPEPDYELTMDPIEMELDSAIEMELDLGG